MKLDRFTVAVTDMEAMVAFYNALFDAELKAHDPFHMGRLGSLELVFCPNYIAEVNAEKNRIQMRFVVADIEAVVAQAEAAGGAAYGERYETDTFIGWGICDPDGNSIELIQPL
jgi:predicted enzyme related to lactoylglutathione lyase